MCYIISVSYTQLFKIDEFIGVTLAGTMLYPTLLTAFSEGAKLSFLELDVILIKYSSSVVPIIVAVYAVSSVSYTHLTGIKVCMGASVRFSMVIVGGYRRA